MTDTIRVKLVGGPADGTYLDHSGGDVIMVAETPAVQITARLKPISEARVQIEKHRYQYARMSSGGLFIFTYRGHE